MSKMRIYWHTKPATDHQKDVIIDRFEHHLKNVGLHDETIKLYIGRVKAFLDCASSTDPDPIIADKYRSMPIEKGLSRFHLNIFLFCYQEIL